MVSPSKEYLRPGGETCNRGRWDRHHTASEHKKPRFLQAASRANIWGRGRSELVVLLVMLVFHQLRRTKSMRDIDF